MTGEREIIPSGELTTNLPVIIVVGKPGAGKGVVCEIIQKHFGIQSTSISSVLGEFLKDAGQREPFTRHQRRHKFAEVTSVHGMDAFAKVIIQRGINSNTQSAIAGIVIDGPRHPEEVELVRKLPNGIAIGLHADELVRYERIRHRKRSGDVEYLDQFRALEQEEGPSISEAINLVDKVFSNQESTVAAHRKLEEEVVSYLQQRLLS